MIIKRNFLKAPNTAIPVSFSKERVQTMLCVILDTLLNEEKKTFEDEESFEDYLVWEKGFKRDEIAELKKCRCFPSIQTIYEKEFSY